MADITYQIKLIQSDGTDFSSANEAGGAVRLRNSVVAGTDSGEYVGNGGASGAFSEIGHGLWEIEIDEEDSGYFRVETQTTAAPAWAGVKGFMPIKIDLEPYLPLDGGTMTDDIVMGDNSVTGIDTLTFTDVNGSVAGIANKNLVDKATAETITGAWAHTGFVDITKDKLKIGGVAVTVTAAEANILDGVTADTAELNLLDGVTSSTAELNKVDGFTGVVADLNILSGSAAAGVTAAELQFIKSVTSDIQTQLDTMLTATQLVAKLVDGSTNSNTVIQLLSGLMVGNSRFAAQVAANRTAISGVATPIGATVPAFIGQVFVDTVLDDIYVATGTANNNDWIAVN